MAEDRIQLDFPAMREFWSATGNWDGFAFADVADDSVVFASFCEQLLARPNCGVVMPDAAIATDIFVVPIFTGAVQVQVQDIALGPNGMRSCGGILPVESFRTALEGLDFLEATARVLAPEIDRANAVLAAARRALA